MTIEEKIKKADEVLAKYEDSVEMHFHQVDRKWLIDCMIDFSQQMSEDLHSLIKSDSVYTLLRGAHKRPSMYGVDDCDDDMFYDLYLISKELRNYK